MAMIFSSRSVITEGSKAMGRFRFLFYGIDSLLFFFSKVLEYDASTNAVNFLCHENSARLVQR